MKVNGVQFALGFMKSTSALPFGSVSAFGSPGAGGALGFADPATSVGYAFVTNRMGTRLAGDPRDVALRAALDTALAHQALTEGMQRAARHCARSDESVRTSVHEPA